MKTDPIVNRIRIVVDRGVLFIILSLIDALVLLLLVLLFKFGVDFRDVPTWLAQAWTPPAGHKLAAVIVYGCLIISVQFTTILYLMIGMWWKKRGHVNHYRGAQIDGGM